MTTQAKQIAARKEEEQARPSIITQDNAEAVERRIAGLLIRKAIPQYLGVFMALYGQGGAGKTTLAAELYKLGRTLYIDAEGGTDSIEHLVNEDNLDIVDVKTYNEFDKLLDALIKDPNTLGYENIVVDNLCEIIDLKINELGIVGNDSHDLSKYNLMTKAVMRNVRALRNLTRSRKLNIIVIAWDEDDKQDSGIVKKQLAFTPALKKEFPGICTIIGHVAVTNDPLVRTLDYAPSPKTVSKFKRSANSSAQKVPFKINYKVDNLPLVDVIKTMKGLQEWPKAQYETANRNAS